MQTWSTHFIHLEPYLFQLEQDIVPHDVWLCSVSWFDNILKTFSAAIYLSGLISDLKQLLTVALERKAYLSFFGYGICELYLVKWIFSWLCLHFNYTTDT